MSFLLSSNRLQKCLPNATTKLLLVLRDVQTENQYFVHTIFGESLFVKKETESSS
jgi:hypothetical protein